MGGSYAKVAPTTDIPVKPMGSEDDDEDWLVGFNEPKSPVPVIWGWTQMLILLVVQTFMVVEYAKDSTMLEWGAMPTWATYVLLQLVCIAYSWIACSYLLPRFPTIAGLPFFLIGFTPALIICAFPFFGDLGFEMAKNAPIWVLTAWSAVRLQFESTVQCHAHFGVKGVSWWLLWPIQTAPRPYTLNYPGFGPVTRTRGGNVDAFSSLTIGLPVALICGIVNDDNQTWIQVLAWIAQVWMFFYLCVLGPVPHFLGGMPGPNNIFDFKGTPKSGTRMDALTSGTLGTCCFWIASYAVIHFIVFVRKMGNF